MSPDLKDLVKTITSPGIAAASVTPPIARSAKIEITSDCDLHCRFCSQTRHPREAREMSRIFFVRLARQLRDAGVERLGLFYIGESMLCEWLPQAIEYAKHECGFPHVFLTTNGLAATPRRVRACMLAGLDSLKFALNFSSRSELRALAGGGPDDLCAILANVKAARRIRDELATPGHRCGLHASSLAYDERQPARMRRLLAAMRPHLDSHYWLPLYGPEGVPRRACGALAHLATPAPRKPVPCWPIFTQAHITRDGKLSACALDASPRFHMGDLTTTSFRDAWQSGRFQQLRAAHLAADVRGTVCEHCIGYPS
jgi:MoaA/NifB/PqqE/SkfB family radical SAM enzyme